MSSAESEQEKGKEELEKGEELKPRVIGSLIISIIAESPPRIDIRNIGMNPYMLPTLLKQLAQNYEDSVLATRSLIE